MVDVIDFNSNDNLLVIQTTNINGVQTESEKSFQDFVNPFSSLYQVQIDDLQSIIEDKKSVNGIINKEVIELYVKKEKIKNEKANKEQQIAHLLNELNGKDINGTSSLFQQAFNYFIDGDVDKALLVLDEANIQEEENNQSNNKQRKAEVRILKARLLIIKNNFDEAGRNYKKALNHFKDWKSSLKAGNFFMFAQDYPKAENYYQISLNEADTDYRKILSLNNLALVHRANNNIKDADDFLNEAFHLSKNLGETQSEVNLFYYAIVLHNIGNQWIDKSEFSKAEECYKIVLKIRKQLEENNPKKYTYKVGETAHHLGIVKEHQKDYKNARNYLQEAEEIFDDLAKNVSENYYFELALTQREIALLESKDKILAKAEVEELYHKALETFYKLPEPIQEINKAFIAGFYNNLGSWQKNNEELSKANDSLQNSLNIARELADQNPSKYLPEVASAHHNIGNNFAKDDDYPKAETHFEKALDILNEFADLAPAKYEITLAKTYMCLGDLYGFEKLDNELLFKKYISKSIELYEKYAGNDKEAKRWGEVAKNILADWKKKWLKDFDKVIDDTFDEYDDVFKALA